MFKDRDRNVLQSEGSMQGRLVEEVETVEQKVGNISKYEVRKTLERKLVPITYR